MIPVAVRHVSSELPVAARGGGREVERSGGESKLARWPQLVFVRTTVAGVRDVGGGAGRGLWTGYSGCQSRASELLQEYVGLGASSARRHSCAPASQRS